MSKQTSCCKKIVLIASLSSIWHTTMSNNRNQIRCDNQGTLIDDDWFVFLFPVCSVVNQLNKIKNVLFVKNKGWVSESRGVVLELLGFDPDKNDQLTKVF